MPTGTLLDPAFEPTDAQLIELSKRAFASVPERNRVLGENLRAQIAELRAQLRSRLSSMHR